MTGLTINFTKHCTLDVGAYVEASNDAITTDGNNNRTHACIALGPSGNRHGSINCFNLDTGRVVVSRTVKQMIWPERLLRKADVWGKKGKKAILKGQIKFLNRKGEKFDWDNDYLTEIEMADKEPKLFRPDFISEIPVIEVESDHEPIIGPKPNTEPEVKSSYVERAKNAHKNSGRKTDGATQSKTRGVDDDEDDASVIDIEEYDDESVGGVYPGINQEAYRRAP